MNASFNEAAFDVIIDLPPCECELNVDTVGDHYKAFNLVLIILALPVVASFGVLGNAISIFVYSRPPLRKISVNFYLSCLAISDIAVDLSGILMISVDSGRRFSSFINAIYLKVVPYGLPLCYMAQTCSVYFTVLAAVDCYISICWPKLKKRYCRIPMAKGLCGLVGLLSVAYNAVLFDEIRVLPCRDAQSNKTRHEVCPSELRQDDTYYRVYKVYMYATFMTILPFLVLLLLNALITSKLWRLSRQLNNRRLSSPAYENNNASAQQQQSMAKTLVRRAQSSKQRSQHFSYAHKETVVILNDKYKVKTQIAADIATDKNGGRADQSVYPNTFESKQRFVAPTGENTPPVIFSVKIKSTIGGGVGDPKKKSANETGFLANERTGLSNCKTFAGRASSYGGTTNSSRQRGDGALYRLDSCNGSAQKPLQQSHVCNGTCAADICHHYQQTRAKTGSLKVTSNNNCDGRLSACAVSKKAGVGKGGGGGEGTVMLVMVVALFLVCNSIALVVNILETMTSGGGALPETGPENITLTPLPPPNMILTTTEVLPDFLSSENGNFSNFTSSEPVEEEDSSDEKLAMIIDVSNFLVVLNSSANFIIYVVFAKSFRKTLLRYTASPCSRSDGHSHGGGKGSLLKTNVDNSETQDSLISSNKQSTKPVSISSNRSIGSSTIASFRTGFQKLFGGAAPARSTTASNTSNSQNMESSRGTDSGIGIADQLQLLSSGKQQKHRLLSEESKLLPDDENCSTQSKGVFNPAALATKFGDCDSIAFADDE